MPGLPHSWTRRLFERAGTVRTGFGLAGFLILVLLVQEAVLGRFRPDLAGDIWIAIVHVLIAVYLLSAYAHCEQSRDRTLESLAPILDAQRMRPILDSRVRDQLVLTGVGAIGVGLSVFSTLYVTPGEASYDPRSWNAENGWHRVLAPFLGFWAARLSARIITEADRLSDVARALRQIDLLDPSGLEPFARQGLTSALLTIGTVSVFALFIVDDVGYLPLVASILVVTLLVGSLGLLLPLRGVRDRVREAKAEELAWCRERMRLARRKLGEGAAERGHLEELVAWEARVEGVNEWTLDASTFTRFALYLLIPIGSWAGGALAERVVDWLLG